MKHDAIPLYIKIRQYLKDQIDCGELKAGDQVPTEAELMTKFQVSRVTITTAIKHLVEEGLVYRIAGKGTFVNSGGETILPSKISVAHSFQKNIIGFIMHPGRDMYMTRLLLGIEEACRDEGYSLLFRSSLSQKDEIEAIKELVFAGVKGLIIYPQDGETYNEAILELKANQFPFVLVDRYLPGIMTNAVFSDNYDGGVLATEYLIGLGHRNIGVVSSSKSKTSSAEERFQGYLETVRNTSLPTYPYHWLTYIDDNAPFHDEIMAMEFIEEWLTEHRDITAIFAVHSLDAIYVSEVAEKLNIRVPEELSICTFDNPGISDLRNVYYTHIKQNLELMGNKAVELLIRSFHNPQINEQIKIAISLVEGKSTCSPFNKDVQDLSANVTIPI
ncbi:GntR family transcriptional regulator [Cohnella silvisoli]|uniref:Substrate-binding domain-containing protein n=1 Tax=Cohnella silvisoli TaxID=2873699 RepID=A0ABV1KM73_9BACL|nr:substrate-binding domain-containing protein [Cohnella silvisoli]MCD9020619.1 substrate-binding domain-containing protein [Cohnella silvisoli]